LPRGWHRRRLKFRRSNARNVGFSVNHAEFAPSGKPRRTVTGTNRQGTLGKIVAA